MEQRAQILLPTTEIGGSVKYFMSIENPFRTNTENWMDPIIQPTLLQFNQATGLEKFIGTTTSLGFWIVVLMFLYWGGRLITALG